MEKNQLLKCNMAQISNNKEPFAFDISKFHFKVFIEKITNLKISW